MDAKKAAEQIAALRDLLRKQKREFEEIADANEKLRDKMDLPSQRTGHDDEGS